ncbi:uncharacterized protein PG986_004770 [Apiospora aurea]|uniref:Uncharacterized protein n=1 Tax=Apiospora aurea TaxID=335848 RepID=A0ABR1QNJ2_9PEZI
MVVGVFGGGAIVGGPTCESPWHVGGDQDRPAVRWQQEKPVQFKPHPGCRRTPHLPLPSVTVTVGTGGIHPSISKIGTLPASAAPTATTPAVEAD